jgi:hypothetical protein
MSQDDREEAKESPNQNSDEEEVLLSAEPSNDGSDDSGEAENGLFEPEEPRNV